MFANCASSRLWSFWCVPYPSRPPWSEASSFLEWVCCSTWRDVAFFTSACLSLSAQRPRLQLSSTPPFSRPPLAIAAVSPYPCARSPVFCLNLRIWINCHLLLSPYPSPCVSLRAYYCRPCTTVGYLRLFGGHIYMATSTACACPTPLVVHNHLPHKA